MSLAVAIGIGLLGGVGAVARFLADGAVAARLASSFPVGTLFVNLSGALALGVLAGATTNDDALHLAATGLLGSYTSFSTWVFESQRLGEDGELRLAVVNLAVSLVLGVALAWVGTKIGGAL
jgi:CrcB protein